jgi:hypothetical protein
LKTLVTMGSYNVRQKSPFIFDSIIFVFIAIISLNARAQAPAQLSGLALLNRCYAHITQNRLPIRHPLRISVQNGTMTAASACMNLLDSARLETGSGLLSSANSETRQILRTFNDFHRSWFPNDDIARSTPEGVEFFSRSRELFDEGESALHVSRALFYQGVPYSEIVTSNFSMEALRANGAQTDDGITVRLLSAVAPGKSSGTVPLNAPLVQTGELQGLRPMTQAVSKINVSANSQHATYVNSSYLYVTDPIFYNQSLGGGILGTRSYLLLNFGRPDTLPMNGGLRLPRRWSKAVLKDLLCRDLPALRFSDASDYVQTKISPATPPFRANASCMGCHATMDPLAETIRNLSLTFVPARSAGTVATAHIMHWPSTLQAATGTVDDDPSFFRRPPAGRLRFRSYNGALIDVPVEGLAELGRAVAATDDLYVCAASKYFQFFTGISVSLQDEGDSSKPALSESEKMYRELVVQMGLRFKSHQSLRTLVQEILTSATYRSESLR